MLIALKLTLDAMNLRIVITPQLRITFGFLSSALGGMLFGPVPGIMIGTAGDLIGYFINSGGGPYFPGFTISAAIAGLFWGIGFYERKVTYVRALLTKGSINLLVNILLNSLWLKILYNKAMLAELPLRIAKNVIMLPIEALIVVLVGSMIKQAYDRAYKNKP